METWKEQGIPLHIVLRGVERSFDSFEAKPRKRSVKTLLYCQEEVEAQFAEWLDSRVGANPSANGKPADSDDDKTKFSAVALIQHLESSRRSLAGLAALRSIDGDDELSVALTRAVSLLEAIEEDFQTGATSDTRKLEDSLTGLERMLNDALLSVVSKADLDKANNELKNQFKAYRNQMEPAVYKQTIDNLLLKRLREQFGVPRLSLFYL